MPPNLAKIVAKVIYALILPLVGKRNSVFAGSLKSK